MQRYAFRPGHLPEQAEQIISNQQVCEMVRASMGQDTRYLRQSIPRRNDNITDIAPPGRE